MGSQSNINTTQEEMRDFARESLEDFTLNVNILKSTWQAAASDARAISGWLKAGQDVLVSLKSAACPL